MSTRSPRVLGDKRYSAAARIGARTCLGENLIHRSGRHGRAIGMSKRGTQSTQLFIARQGLPNANLFFGRSCRRHDIGHGIKRIFHVAGLSLSAQVRHPAPLSTPSRNSGSGDAARRAASTASAVGMYRNTVIVRCCAGFRTPECRAYPRARAIPTATRRHSITSSAQPSSVSGRCRRGISRS
jgi:hypothetical protein